MTRSSSDIIKEQTKSMTNAATLDSLHSAKMLAKELKNKLIKQELKEFFDISKKIWEIKKNYASCIVPSDYDNLQKSLLQRSIFLQNKWSRWGWVLTTFCRSRE